MTKTQNQYPEYTSLTCERCDGIGFLVTDDAWMPKQCDCMEDAPKIVEPYKKD
tara:strand:- start:357 stop:515 length:159 start_codon:yes stop_codon:yes gene_type:complete